MDVIMIPIRCEQLRVHIVVYTDVIHLVAEANAMDLHFIWRS